LKAARRLLDGTDWYLPAPGSTGSEWMPTLGAAGAVALAYFLAARLGLALLSPGSDMAVFWPAAGIPAGFLIATGPRDLIAYELGGTVDLAFAPNGLSCRPEIPSDWLTKDGAPASDAIACASSQKGNARI
jgi:hypothetical protein